MLGSPKPRRLDEPIAISLEALVPQDHFYRHLEAKLDLAFVRDWTRDLYAERGRPSIDPVVFFKLQLVMFFEGIRSERKLIEIASLNLAHRWYLGYALDEDLPDHSSLTRIRQRLGIDVFQRFFEQVVDFCQEAGLVWGRELYVDATKVEGSQVVARLASATVARTPESQYSGTVGRGGTRPQAPPGGDGLGTTTRPVWEPHDPPETARAIRHHLQLTISQPGIGAGSAEGAHEKSRPKHFFNGLAHYRNRPPRFSA